MGFLGSSLVIALVNLGARVTIVDSLVRGCGGNPHNVAPVVGSVRILRHDIGAVDHVRDAIRRANVIFNLAGEISHIHSMRFPQRDAALNASSQLNFLEECARTATGVRIVYAGTRQIYGVPRYLPVDEDHPICPVDFNGVHNYAAMMYHLLYARLGQVDAVVLNLTNLYGPRLALSIPCQGFLGNFVRKMMTGCQLEVFGDGRQLRDPLYVDDAVDLFLLAGAAEQIPSRIYNAGGPEPLEIRCIAEIVSRIGGLRAPAFRPFTAEQKRIDIGSYYSDNGLVQRELGWVPKIRFEEGIQRTYRFYCQQLDRYLEPGVTEPACQLMAATKQAQAFSA